MSIRYLGFVLLIGFPGALHAQGAQSCSAPRLDGGFFVPKQQIYSHGAKLSFSCDDGWKLTVKGWWATSTCDHGKWSHEPQCIESTNACGEPPRIPHAVIINQEYQDFYAADTNLQYECKDGYTVKRDQIKTITCRAGSWTEGPACSSASNCSVKSADYPELEPAGVIVLQDGEKLKLQCVHDPTWWTTHYMVFRCNDGTLTRSKCCDLPDTHLGIC